MTRPALVITCEHGGNHIPAVYRPLFEGQDAVLQSHRGFDAGALKMAETLAEAFGAPLVSATVSRLLVDLNRSTHNRTLHAEGVRRLPATQRQQVLTTVTAPLRQWVTIATTGTSTPRNTYSSAGAGNAMQLIQIRISPP